MFIGVQIVADVGSYNGVIIGEKGAKFMLVVLNISTISERDIRRKIRVENVHEDKDSKPFASAIYKKAQMIHSKGLK